MRQELEIERKWLLSELPNLPYESIIHIEQYYRGYTRYRKEFEKGVESFMVIEKRRVSAGTNIETWEESKPEDFYFNYPIHEKPITKKRHVFHCEGHKFEVDVFENHLVVVEVELKSLIEPIVFPGEISAVIITEVTDNPRYSNYNLFKEFNQP